MTAIAARILAWLLGRPAIAAVIGGGMLLALLAVAAVAGVQTLRLAAAHTTIAELQRDAAEGLAARSEAARLDSDHTATKERTHAAEVQDAVDAFNRGELAHLPELRDRLADTERLLAAAETRAAGYRAQAAGDAAARERLAHRAAQLDRTVAEGRRLVEELRGAVEQRDAQVTLLLGIIRADRGLIGSPSH